MNRHLLVALRLVDVLRTHRQRTRPRFKWTPPSFITVKERHRLVRNKFVLRGCLRGRTINRPPGAGVKVNLIQHERIGETGIKRNGLRLVCVAVHDVASPSVAKVRFGQRVLVKRTR